MQAIDLIGNIFKFNLPPIKLSMREWEINWNLTPIKFFGTVVATIYHHVSAK